MTGQVLGRGLVAAALADVLGRHGEVDAVGLAFDVFVDPVELDFETLGFVGERAEYAEAPALVTAATTSRQWLNAKIGNSIPS